MPNQQQNQQGQSTGTSQAIMKEPPQVVTTKDLLYLRDQLSWHLNAMKKCAHYAQETTDPDIKRELDNAGKMHMRHYQMLLNHCQNQNSQQIAQFNQAQMNQQSQMNQSQMNQ